MKIDSFEKIFSDPERGTFTSFQVVKMLKIRQERLQEWLHKDFIKPKFPAAGRGTKNYFSKKNLYEIALFNYLLNRGLSRKESSKILKANVMDPVFHFMEKSFKAHKADVSVPSIIPLLIIFKSGNKYSSKHIFDLEIKFNIKSEITDKNIDEVQIINLDKIVTTVNRAIQKMS